jgi:hypothetical protein
MKEYNEREWFVNENNNNNENEWFDWSKNK